MLAEREMFSPLIAEDHFSFAISVLKAGLGEGAEIRINLRTH